MEAGKISISRVLKSLQLRSTVGVAVALAALFLMVLFVLSVLRRLYYKVMELKEIRAEMRRLKGGFRHQDS